MYWYEDEVKRLEKDRRKINYEPETLFYGSSSIRMWESLYEDFIHIKPVNLGFGGSTLAACVWFFERIMSSYRPSRLIVYAGDNDLGDGRHPEEIFIFFQQLLSKAEGMWNKIPCYYVSLKPSPSRWDMSEKFRYTNNLIKNEIIKRDDNWKFIDVFGNMLNHRSEPVREYYAEDGLHLSKKGYEVWKNVISNSLGINN